MNFQINLVAIFFAMSNYWNIPGVPHKGWNLLDVVDVRENGQAEWETNYDTCMMCGNEK